MEEFKTPTTKKCRSRIGNNPDLQTPIKIPASPFLQQIGYGCGVNVFVLERSPKVGFARSPWAIKKTNSRITKDKKYNERIRIEADILRQLKHPNIVGFRALTQAENGDPCLAMEKLDVSLGDIIEEKLNNGDDPFPAKKILKVAYEMAKGLEYLHHTAHILHGDIKSYNVLVSTDLNTVKLCDFGVSVPLTETLEMDTSKGNFEYIGTECWNAPEIINEEGPITNKTDMWSYGLVLWEMIALSPPHVGSGEESLLETSFDDMMSEDDTTNTKNLEPDIEMDDSINYLEDMMKAKYGTRPPLPAIDLGPEYQKVLEIFFACTTADYKSRPSAKGVIMFFRKCVYPDANKSD